MSIHESNVQLLTVDASKFILKNDGSLDSVNLIDLMFYVRVDLIDFTVEESVCLFLIVQYCEGNVLVSRDGLSARLEEISVDEDILNQFIRKILNQSFFLDCLREISEESTSNTNLLNDMIQLIQTESHHVRISEDEKKKINKVRLLKVTGLAE